MFKLFEPRSSIEKLRSKYSNLMRRSYELAMIDKERSDLVHEKACSLLKEIRRMEQDKSYSH